MFDLDLYSLMDIQITSAGRKEQNLTDVAAAIYVIDQDDIHNSGATSIMALLRRVPGLQVARIASNQWAITSRGFNGMFANKLLVQIDGRSVYTPTHSGVFWSIQDIMLEDIERIEIIRGPGATLWGANAVNGIINVITKKTMDTQGVLISTATGNHEKALTSLRYGTTFGNNIKGRIYAINHNVDSFERYHTNDDTDDAGDAGKITKGGFRLDGDINHKQLWTLQGDIYSAKEEMQIYPYWTPAPMPGTFYDDTETTGANLLGRWKQQLSEKHSYTIQMYLDHTNRNSELLDEQHTIFDIDLQHNFSLNDWNDTVWGLGYRYLDSSYGGSYMLTINPQERYTDLFSAFVQNEITLIADKVWLTIGAKFEKNDHSGSETQPSIKMMWKANDNHRVWFSISQAVRTSSQVERASTIVFGAVPVYPYPKAYVHSDPDFKSEELIAYEAGYRYLHNENFTIDLTLFYNKYKNLLLHRQVNYTQIDITNDMDGHSLGIELSAQWQPLNWLSAELNYSYIKVSANPHGYPAGVNSVSATVAEDSSPRHQIFLHTAIDISNSVRLNLQGRYTDALDTPSQTSYWTQQSIDAYFELDANICWQINESLALQLVGQDLLDSRHLEFVSESFVPATEIGRSIYAKLSWEY